jgi:hypothetical protein
VFALDLSILKIAGICENNNNTSGVIRNNAVE